MQHLNSMHWAVSPSDDPANYLPHGGGEYDTEQHQAVPSALSSPTCCSSTPSHDVNTEFIGPGKKIYRNYHPHLSGEYAIVSPCCSYWWYTLRSAFSCDASEHFSLRVQLLSLCRQSPEMIGGHFTAVFTLNLPTSYTCEIRCLACRLTDLWIFGQPPYSKLMVNLFLLTTKACTRWLTAQHLATSNGTISPWSILASSQIKMCCHGWMIHMNIEY